MGWTSCIPKKKRIKSPGTNLESLSLCLGEQGTKELQVIVAMKHGWD